MSRRLKFPLAALAAFGTAVIVLAACEVSAKVPDPRNSTVEPVLVGNTTGHAMISQGDRAATGAPGFLVLIRDINNSPIGPDHVELEFLDPGVRLCATQSPGTTIDCARRVLSKSSTWDGIAVFTPCFGGSTVLSAILVSADGVSLAEVPARSTDLDADGTTELADLSGFARAFLAEPDHHPEVDFDASGGPVGLTDFALFAEEFLAATRATYCP